MTDSAGTTPSTWNARDQLVSLSEPSVTASFQYDVVGRRKSKTVNGTTTHFLYDGLNVAGIGDVAALEALRSWWYRGMRGAELG